MRRGLLRFSPTLLRPSGVAVAGPLLPTYADFLAYATTSATNGLVGFNSFPIVGRYRTAAITPTGNSYGTSWQSFFERLQAGDSSVSRLIQHGLPSAAELTSQISNGRQVLYQIVAIGDQTDFVGITRHGYTSVTETLGPTIAGQMTVVEYWDGTAAQRMNPSAGTGPTPFTLPGF